MRKHPNRYVCLDCGSKNLGLKPCSVEGCDNSTHARGWCAYHYKRWHKHGDPQAPDQRKRDEDFTALDEAPIWEGVDQHTKERLNVA